MEARGCHTFGQKREILAQLRKRSSTHGGGGWSEGWRREAGSQSRGSGWPGKAEKAEEGNCIALRNGLGACSLSGILVVPLTNDCSPHPSSGWDSRAPDQLGLGGRGPPVYLGTCSPQTNTEPSLPTGFPLLQHSLIVQAAPMGLCLCLHHLSSVSPAKRSLWSKLSWCLGQV